MNDGTSRDLLLITTPEGTEFVPEVAFAAACARRLGLSPRIMATDFCTTGEGFQSDLRAAAPFGAVFFDAPEFREVVHGLSALAVGVGVPRVVVAGIGMAEETPPPSWPEGVRAAPGARPSALAEALGLPVPAGLAPETLALDVDVYGGPALLDRALGASLFGDLDTAALLGVRGFRRASSPCAALARLEGAVDGDRRELLRPAVAHAPLERLGSSVKRVEWWDRDFFEATVLHPSWAGVEAADRAYLAPLKERGLFQTVRTNARVPGPILETLRDLGVGRVVFDCDALEEGERLPGADATATEVAAAIRGAREVGLETGVLFVVGLPRESVATTARRCDVLRFAGPDRVRVVPFEPTGGRSAEWCRLRGLWPPLDLRWNRELFQPLRQPELGPDNYARLFDEALAFAAEVAVAPRP